jgi:tetratricopeptide (TPR) repeat protein
MQAVVRQAADMEIEREVAKLVTARQELALLRAAYQRAGSADIRAKLVHLLFLDEAFGEVIELLADAGDATFAELTLLWVAYMSIESVDSDPGAEKAARRAEAIAANAPQRAAALAMRGKAETRQGMLLAARQSLIAALELDPANKDACKRFAALHLEADEPQPVLDMTEALLAKGAAHARLLAVKALAEARVGDTDAAQETMGLTHFLHQEMLGVPDGWGSRDAFNSALADELLNHPCLRFERYGSASQKSWRVETPVHPKAPLVSELLDQIEHAINRYLESLPVSDNPWIRARPERGFLRSWCVITESEGFESWHVHQYGWLSGVYYVQVPQSISEGTDRGGCLGFGLPADLAGEDGSQSFGEQIIRPKAGMMLAFPSQCYHRTYPHGGREKRICFAFDIQPN